MPFITLASLPCNHYRDSWLSKIVYFLIPRLPVTVPDAISLLN